MQCLLHCMGFAWDVATVAIATNPAALSRSLCPATLRGAGVSPSDCSPLRCAQTALSPSRPPLGEAVEPPVSVLSVCPWAVGVWWWKQRPWFAFGAAAAAGELALALVWFTGLLGLALLLHWFQPVAFRLSGLLRSFAAVTPLLLLPLANSCSQVSSGLCLAFGLGSLPLLCACRVALPRRWCGMAIGS